ncbi:ATP-dependent RNA helicase RhlE [Candidatus Kinetoplastibacterium desouzaii TCC079E]|uniref:ATP-dependent RNA helicase RhlE n=1 Tax=Candidatus Kinetoplastidibacterium desouzai TCC079E TaxID=1208919 RepID=M1LUW5_9PROT|nr:DEAD/DEAH box helicase [Candidatus Kinetoplastibacterium desouzaii]AGF47084.1 ATP-dependent RNA helicase RhlE [Candidatus Kinetoplastibacterium desouzaii TCC079E]
MNNVNDFNLRKEIEKDDSTFSFSDFGLNKILLDTIISIGHTKPTPIQEKSIPLILEGRDVIGAAQTGTGKTAAFVVPIINRLLPFANPSSSPARHLLRSLILVPTRELASQVYESIKIYSKNTNLRSLVLFGGTDHNSQEDKLRLGSEILVATPGRLIAHMEQGSLHTQNISILVLDEADRMLDMGFMPDVDKIVNALPKYKQILLFSATFSNSIRKIGLSYLNNPVEIDVTVPNSIADTVEQISYMVPNQNKLLAILFILQSKPLESVIIFTNTKLATIKLSSFLFSKNIKCDSIHGDKNQIDRTIALENFRNGSLNVLVATDVAARGLDVVGVSYVINFDVPFNPEDYVHRIGRTGRANNKGSAISLCSYEEETCLLNIEKFTGSKIPRLKLNMPSFSNYDDSFDKNSLKSSILLDIDPLLEPKRVSKNRVVLPANYKNRRNEKKIAILLGGTGRD